MKTMLHRMAFIIVWQLHVCAYNAQNMSEMLRFPFIGIIAFITHSLSIAISIKCHHIAFAESHMPLMIADSLMESSRQI